MSRVIRCILCLISWLGLCSGQLPNVDVNFSCKGGYEWMLNSKGENPCRVYAYLSAQSRCFSNDTWTVEPLDNDQKRYPPPSGDDATPCQCNEPVYSLVQACTACQGFSATIRWSDWTHECEDTYIGFPYGLSPDIDIPGWANLDVIQADRWNEAVAKTYADEQRAELSDGTPDTSDGNHKKDMKIIIGSSVGVGCALIIVGVIIWLSMRKKRRAPPPGGVETPSDNGTLKGTGNLQGHVPPTLPMSQKTDQTPPTWTSEQRRKRPTSEVSGHSQVGNAPTQGPGKGRGQGSIPARRRPDDDSSSDRSLTDETPYLKPAGPAPKRLPPRGRVDEDDESEDPVYRPSSAYQGSSQAMLNWRNGAGGASSAGQQPISSSWGTGRGGGGGYQRPGASKFLATFGADPATRWSPFRKSPVTGTDSDPAGPLPSSPPSQNPTGWTGPSTRFNVNDAQRDGSSGNPDAPTDSPSPAVAAAPSSGSQQPAARASQNAKVPKRQARKR